MSVPIREARAGDWPALFDLWVESWSAFLPEIDFVARLPWFRTYVADLQRGGVIVLVAEFNDGHPAGFVTVDAARQDMDQLVTALRAQRQGVGRALLRAAKRSSPAGLSLSVVQNNTPAIRLYRSEGFAMAGEGISARSGLMTFRMRWAGLAGEAENAF